jgi:hypothetical protein
VTKHVELHWHTVSDGDALTEEGQGCGVESPKTEDGAANFQPLDGTLTTVTLAFTDIEGSTRLRRGHEENGGRRTSRRTERREWHSGSSNEGYAAGLMPMLVASGLSYLLKAVSQAAAQFRIENGRVEPRDQPSRACTHQRVDEVCCGIGVRTRVC